MTMEVGRVVRTHIAHSLDKRGEQEAAVILGQLLRKAIRLEAHTIHLEPRPTSIAVRCRLDGRLRETQTLSRHLLPDLITSVQELAELSPLPHRPQEGTFPFQVKSVSYTVFASIIPTINGDKVVLRIISDAVPALSPAALGIYGAVRNELSLLLTKPRGLVLIASPDAASRAALLRSCVYTIQHPSLHIIQIEDRIDTRLPGVQQVQLQPLGGLDTAQAIQLCLQQDPNVIVLDTLTNQQSLDIMAGAAAKHTVLATITAHQATHGYLQCMHSTTDSLSFANNTAAIIAAQTVPRLCADCRITRVVDTSLRTAITRRLRAHDVTAEAFAEIVRSYAHDLDRTTVSPARWWSRNAAGCQSCGYTGQKGTILICELLVLNTPLRALLHSKPTPKKFAAEASKHGFYPMRIDALAKAQLGLIDSTVALDIA